MEGKIIFEDSDMLVVDKPAGMIVNRADTTKDVVTLQEWAEQRMGFRKSVNGDDAGIGKGLRKTSPNNDTGFLTDNLQTEFESRGGIVHRLDKETSGIIVIAKNDQSFENLKNQFKGRNVKKTYIALVHGDVVPTKGEINAPIGRLPWNRTHFGILATGREAVSSYKVLGIKYLDLGKTREALSLVEVYPSTGRTHQIRVHMRHIGYPVFADELYAGRKTSKRDRKILPRHFLHASKLSLNHPMTGESITFESELPSDLKEFLDMLSNNPINK